MSCRKKKVQFPTKSIIFEIFFLQKLRKSQYNNGFFSILMSQVPYYRLKQIMNLTKMFTFYGINKKESNDLLKNV